MSAGAWAPREMLAQCCCPSRVRVGLARVRNVRGPESVGFCPYCPLGASISQPEEETG